MAVLEIAKMGNPVLRLRAKEVAPKEISSPETQRLIDDMIDTMRAASGAGIAAPQVSISKRIVLVEVGRNPRYPDAPHIPLTVLINPKIEPLTDVREPGWEGCLSVDNLRGIVSRPLKIHVEFLDRDGKSHDMIAEGFFARAIQHECDHLDGVLYIDRVDDTRTLTQLREFEQFHLAPGTEMPPD